MSFEEGTQVEDQEDVVTNHEPSEPGSGGDSPPDPPAYTPSYSYKVLDEEREIPEWARGVITDPDREKEVKELFQRADGLQHVKTRRDELEQRVKEWQPLVQSAQELYDLKKKKDYESFFEKTGLSDDDIFEYASRRLELRQNPDAFRAHEQHRQWQTQNEQLRIQQQTFEQQQVELQAQRRAWELDMELSKPDIAVAVSDYDARVGQSGAFRNEVIKRGLSYSALGQDITPNQAAREVLHMIGWQGKQTPAPTGVQTQPRQTPPTLPNIKGRGTSPAKVVPTSTDGLRELAKKFRG